jgi:hypothetical protein
MNRVTYITAHGYVFTGYQYSEERAWAQYATVKRRLDVVLACVHITGKLVATYQTDSFAGVERETINN